MDVGFSPPTAGALPPAVDLPTVCRQNIAVLFNVWREKGYLNEIKKD